MNARDIVGTWRGGGQKVLAEDGSVKSSRGPTPGYIVYTPEGNMMALPCWTSSPVKPRTIGSSMPSLVSSVDEKAG